MTTKDLKKLESEVRKVVRQASQFIKGEVGRVESSDIETKEKNSLVSYVDKNAEEIIVTGLSKLLPGAAFLTEEDVTQDSEGDIRWIIDPLDGTTNFLFSIPHFSVSVALEIEGELSIGVVEEVNHYQTFHASKGGGAFLNDHAISVRKNSAMSDSMVSTGFPYNIRDTSPILQTVDHWIHNTRGVRRFGSAALDLAYVAWGRYDFYYEKTLNAWDVAAGALLIKEAGGIVTDVNGNKEFLFNGNILGASADMYFQALDVLKKYGFGAD